MDAHYKDTARELSHAVTRSTQSYTKMRRDIQRYADIFNDIEEIYRDSQRYTGTYGDMQRCAEMNSCIHGLPQLERASRSPATPGFLKFVHSWKTYDFQLIRTFL